MDDRAKRVLADLGRELTTGCHDKDDYETAVYLGSRWGERVGMASAETAREALRALFGKDTNPVATFAFRRGSAGTVRYDAETEDRAREIELIGMCSELASALQLAMPLLPECEEDGCLSESCPRCAAQSALAWWESGGADE